MSLQPIVSPVSLCPGGQRVIAVVKNVETQWVRLQTRVNHGLNPSVRKDSPLEIAFSLMM